MANSAIGLPQILITFSTAAATLINRSSRGAGAMILNDANVKNEVKYYELLDVSDIPSGISEKNADLIRKAFLGTPTKIHVYLIPPATYEMKVESDVVVTDASTGETDTVTSEVTVTKASEINQNVVLKKVSDVRFNYICHPTGNRDDQQNLASWIKSQRKNREKTGKAVVANFDADDYGVVNFTTGGIKLDNPAYIAALELADGDENAVNSDIAKYNTYTATEYTARIMGILCGISLDRSATYYELPEIVSVDEHDDIDGAISSGEFCLFDEKDGNGVKVARGVNSLHTFTAETGSDFRFLKNVDAMDMIKDDIRDTFRNEYVGKVSNSYENRMLLIAAINSYLNSLGGSVLEPNADNYVELDYEKHREWAKMHNKDVEEMTEAQILRTSTGSNVFLTGHITLVNAMEDFVLAFTLD